MKTENLNVRSRMFDFSYKAERYPQVIDAMFELAAAFRVANSNEQSRHLDYKGDCFDNLHKLFENRYKYYDEEYDIVCELIRQGYIKCNLNLQKCIELAKLKLYDVSQVSSLEKVISESHAEGEELLSKAEAVLNLVRGNGSVKLVAIEDEMTQIIKYLNKSNWLLRSNLQPQVSCNPNQCQLEAEPVPPPAPKPAIPVATSEPAKAELVIKKAEVKPRGIMDLFSKPKGMPPTGCITVTQRTITKMPEAKNLAQTFIHNAPEVEPMNLDKVRLFLSKLGRRR